MKLQDCRGFVESVNEACTCGGGGPPDCCSACKVYHAVKDFEVGKPAATDTAIATRYVCATTADWALIFEGNGQSKGKLEEAHDEKLKDEVDFEIIVIARRIEP